MTENNKNSFDLERFLKAQEQDYAAALSEIKAGRKRTHWMWYIFPQSAGLGLSEASRFYGIKDLAEARAFLNHPILGERLREITGELLALETSDANAVFGYPDDLKLKSSMTLFDAASASRDNVFARVLEKFFGGIRDQKTLEIISSEN